jgi:hypothetical protein
LEETTDGGRWDNYFDGFFWEEVGASQYHSDKCDLRRGGEKAVRGNVSSGYGVTNVDAGKDMDRRWT